VARALRGAIDLEELGPIAITVDCDVLNADGGTRCASITAANIALRLAIRRLIRNGKCLPADLRLSPEQIRNGKKPPRLSAKQAAEHELAVLRWDLAAISVGLIDGEVYTDLDYILDSNADVDMNVVMISNGKYVEVQGTGEEFTYTRDELDALLDAANAGIEKLNEIQASILDGVE
jgi:ribonuclease PH